MNDQNNNSAFTQMLDQRAHETTMLIQKGELLLWQTDIVSFLRNCGIPTDLPPELKPLYEHQLDDEVRLAINWFLWQDMDKAHYHVGRVAKLVENAQRDGRTYLSNEKQGQDKKSREAGRRGGSVSKRSQWAQEVAEVLVQLQPKTEADAWAHLQVSSNPLEIEIGGDCFEVYVDGDSLCAEIAGKPSPRPIKKSTFFKNYYRPAKNSGK